MTVQEILDLIWTQTEESGTTYSSETLIGYINKALDDLTVVAKMLDCVSEVPLTIVDGKAAIKIADTLPLNKAHEFIEVYFTPDQGQEERLRKLPAGDTVSRGWVLTASEIQLRKLGAEAGAARVEFYRKLAHVTKPEDVPDLLEQYHNLLVLYGCAAVQERETAIDLKHDFISEYVAAKQAFAMQRVWEMEPQYRNMIRQARVFTSLGIKPGR